MNVGEMLAVFRDEMSDAAAPYLWSDLAVLRYIDDAQKMFCRLTEGIEDSLTDAVTKISVVPGTEWFDTSRLILKLRSAVREDTGRAIELVTLEKAPYEGINFLGHTGPIKALVSGFHRNKLRAWPMPDETVTVRLNVFRLPLEPINDLDQEFEVDEQHHEGLMLWVKHKAYSKQDSETFDRNKAADFKGLFEQYCARARTEQERARRTTGTVVYGGI